MYAAPEVQPSMKCFRAALLGCTASQWLPNSYIGLGRLEQSHFNARALDSKQTVGDEQAL